MAIKLPVKGFCLAVGMLYAASAANAAAEEPAPVADTSQSSHAHLIECWNAKDQTDDQIAAATDAASTTKLQKKAQQEAKQQSTEVLQKFAVSSGSGSTIVTTHIASAYAPMLLPNDPKAPAVRPWNDLGIDLSASLNAQNQTESDYLRQELLTRYGGVGNMYFSLAGRNPCNSLYHWGDRC